MTVNEALCHLDDSYLVCMGEKPVKDVSNPFSRTIMKFFALSVPLTWPKGIQTGPEVEQGKGGTPPVEFNSDRQRLLASIDRFIHADLSRCGHPMFGAMTRDQWMRWGYLHVDHHLRQFNA